MDNPVIIFGAGGLGKAALDIFNSVQITVYCFLDDDHKLHGTVINEVSVLGSTENDKFIKLIGKKCEAFIASDDNRYRRDRIGMLMESRKTMPINSIHANTVISKSAIIGHGNFINSGVILGATSEIGNHCILHSNAVIDYDVRIGNFVQIGTGSVINSGASIGNETFIGSGVTIVSGVTIGKGAKIGAGSVVIAGVTENTTVFGNPAEVIRKK